MRNVGGALTDYDSKNEGIIGDAAGVAGSIYSTVGCMGTAAESKECKDKEKAN